MIESFDPEALPAVGSWRLIYLEDFEEQLLKRAPGIAELDELYRNRAFRYFIARVKEQALQRQADLIDGQPVPAGLTEGASGREAYFAGLVKNARGIIDLQRVLWQDARRRDGDDDEAPEKPRVAPEETFSEEPGESK